MKFNPMEKFELSWNARGRYDITELETHTISWRARQRRTLLFDTSEIDRILYISARNMIVRIWRRRRSTVMPTFNMWYTRSFTIVDRLYHVSTEYCESPMENANFDTEDTRNESLNHFNDSFTSQIFSHITRLTAHVILVRWWRRFFPKIFCEDALREKDRRNSIDSLTIDLKSAWRVRIMTIEYEDVSIRFAYNSMTSKRYVFFSFVSWIDVWRSSEYTIQSFKYGELLADDFIYSWLVYLSKSV